MLKFYYAPGTCAFASHIALYEAEAEFEAVRLSFADEDQKKGSYLQINPKARVPALETDRGVITETPAILMYLAQTFPQAKMAPLDDPYALAHVQSLNSYLCATVHVAHAHKHRGARWADDPDAIANMTAMVPKTMAACFQLIEDKIFQGPFAMGEACTISDFYLFTVSNWLAADEVDIRAFPKVHGHNQFMSKRASVLKAVASEAS